MHPVMGQVAKGMIITGAFAAALGMAFWVGSTQRDEAYMRFITEESAKESAKPASSEPRDRLAIAACIEFNQAANDAMDRVATEYQTSQRLPKVFEDGRLADSPIVRNAFMEFQRARLSGNEAAYKRAVMKVMLLSGTVK